VQIYSVAGGHAAWNESLKCPSPTTGPGLRANFIRIIARDSVALDVNATSMVFYVIQGAGIAESRTHVSSCSTLGPSDAKIIRLQAFADRLAMQRPLPGSTAMTECEPEHSVALGSAGIHALS
jgi:hypothetical protein